MKRLLLALLVANGGYVLFAQSCPVVYTGSFCAIPNQAEPPFYRYCGASTIIGGPYFDSAALTFTPTIRNGDVSTNSCGQNCISQRTCYQTTITTTGPDCNGITQTVTHADCCEQTPD